ncbi:hypothetical protein STCU_10692 [Strigomonas culicis]|uniref:Uncharacterized protein n=1 Tax=Strigomonas culicis TaxID=28005 RepID=S9TLR3_9TRYP|nr:hypothetical protein STCU_10692 [Strigomonas culicis]|eukprot:EPY17308.1 hypothetical protein STCU_10692 [Strigomonas culicis]
MSSWITTSDKRGGHRSAVASIKSPLIAESGGKRQSAAAARDGTGPTARVQQPNRLSGEGAARPHPVFPSRPPVQHRHIYGNESPRGSPRVKRGLHTEVPASVLVKEDSGRTSSPLYASRRSNPSEVGLLTMPGAKRLFFTSSFVSSSNVSLSSGALMHSFRRGGAAENVTPVVNTPFADYHTAEGSPAARTPRISAVPLASAEAPLHAGGGGAPCAAGRREDYLEAERRAFQRVPPIPRLPLRLRETVADGAAHSGDFQLSHCLSIDESEGANSPTAVRAHGIDRNGKYFSAVNSPQSPHLTSTTQDVLASSAMGPQRAKRKGYMERMIVHEPENSVSATSSCQVNQAMGGLGVHNPHTMWAHPNFSVMSEQLLAASLNNRRDQLGAGEGRQASVGSDERAASRPWRGSSADRKAMEEFFSYVTKRHIITLPEFWHLGSFFLEEPILEAVAHACAASFCVLVRAEWQLRHKGYLSGATSRQNGADTRDPVRWPSTRTGRCRRTLPFWREAPPCVVTPRRTRRTSHRFFSLTRCRFCSTGTRAWTARARITIGRTSPPLY